MHPEYPEINERITLWYNVTDESDMLDEYYEEFEYVVEKEILTSSYTMLQAAAQDYHNKVEGRPFSKIFTIYPCDRVTNFELAKGKIDSPDKFVDSIEIEIFSKINGQAQADYKIFREQIAELKRETERLNTRLDELNILHARVQD